MLALMAAEDKLPGWTMKMLNEPGSSWTRAIELSGLSNAGAYFSAFMRLLFWHWLQPALYFLVFACYWHKLDSFQLIFGTAVAVRELLYLLSTLICVVLNPSYLLLDVAASVRSTDLGIYGGYKFLALYVLAPEKFVAYAMFGRGGALNSEGLIRATFVCEVVLDLCGVGALASGLLASSKVPAALAVGYIATTLGGVYILGLWVVVKVVDAYENYMYRDNGETKGVSSYFLAGSLQERWSV
jgi:hypothetical protein